MSRPKGSKNKVKQIVTNCDPLEIKALQSKEEALNEIRKEDEIKQN